MIRRPPRSTLSSSSAASDVYKRQSRSDHQSSRMRWHLAWAGPGAPPVPGQSNAGRSQRRTAPDPSTRGVSGSRRLILFKQPSGNGPGGQAVVAVVIEDPAQSVPVAASIGSLPLPLPPPEQGPRPIHTGLTPLKPLPNSHGLEAITCLLYTSPSPRDRTRSRMPSSA